MIYVRINLHIYPQSLAIMVSTFLVLYNSLLIVFSFESFVLVLAE